MGPIVDLQFPQDHACTSAHLDRIWSGDLCDLCQVRVSCFLALETIKAIILGVIQGLTEFLPVSSSGHIELAEYFLKIENLAQDEITLTLILHLATALSTIVVFRKRIMQLVRDLFSSDKSARMYALLIALSMIPAGLVGVFFEDQLDALMSEKIWLVGIALLLTAALLYLADRDWKNVKNINMPSALMMGAAQMVALTPGVSRSGATISTGLISGLQRSVATEFSFLMVLPLILGKVGLDLVSGDFSSSAMSLDLLWAFLAAFIVGVLACRWMIALVKKSRLIYFAMYCLIMGSFAIVHHIWIA